VFSNLPLSPARSPFPPSFLFFAKKNIRSRPCSPVAAQCSNVPPLPEVTLKPGLEKRACRSTGAGYLESWLIPIDRAKIGFSFARFSGLSRLSGKTGTATTRRAPRESRYSRHFCQSRVNLKRVLPRQSEERDPTISRNTRTEGTFVRFMNNSSIVEGISARHEPRTVICK